jgi:DNA-binding XRE family transcriptional regulator
MTPEDMKAARKALGLSQQKLADELGLTRQTIHVMENSPVGIDNRTEKAIWCLLYENDPSLLQKNNTKRK